MGSKGGKSQTTSSSTEPPAWVQNALKTVVSRGDEVYNLPLTQYAGPTLAGFTPDQQAAFSSIRGASGSWDPYMSSAMGLVNQGTQDIWGQLPEYNMDNLDQYFDPYRDSVINNTLDAIRRSDAMQQQDLTSDAIKMGAWGGSGAMDASTNLAREQATARNKTISDLYSQGYENAAQKFLGQQAAQLGALSQTQSNQLQGAGLYGNLGSQNLQNILSQAQAQLAGGTQQQGLVQEQLNIPYQQFLQQQAYPYEQLQYYANLINAVSGGAGGTTTGTTPGQKSNVVGDIVGLGLTAAGLFSDRRVKDDIKKVGKLDNGLPVYSYRYKGQPQTQIGLMAQDVEKKNPDAVGGIAGIKTVDYAQATKKNKADGGRVRGGIAALENYNRINSDGFVSARLNAPAPVSPPQQEDSGMDIAGILSALGGAGGSSGILGNGVRTIGMPNQKIDPLDYLSRGARKDISYANMGGMGPYRFADGGKVDDTPVYGGETAIPYPDFKPVVAGTPVYGFNPNAANGSANMGVQVKTSHDQILNNLKSKAAAEPAARTSQINYPALMAVLARGNGKNQGNYALAQMLGEDKSGNIINSFTNQPLHESTLDIMRRQGLIYADGGIVGKPRVLASQPQEVAPGVPAVGDPTKSYIPTADFKSAGLSAPRAPSPQARPQMTPAPWAQEFAGSPELSQGIAPEQTDQVKDMNMLDRAMDTPWRMGLIGAGIGMMANNGENVMDDIAAGLKSGVGAYAGLKKSKADAKKEADKLAMDAEKARMDMDFKIEDQQMRRDEMGLRREEMRARIDRDKRDEYDVKEGEDQFYRVNKRTGEVEPAGGKTKKSSARAALDVSPSDINGIETAALSMVPGAIQGYDQYNRPIIDDAFTALVGPKKISARKEAARVYQETRDAASAQAAYLREIGIDPETDAFEPAKREGQFNPFKKNVDTPAKMGKNKDAVLSQARDAIERGAPRDKVIERIKSMGIDPKGL